MTMKSMRAGLAVLAAAALATTLGYGTSVAHDYSSHRWGAGSIEGHGSAFGSFRFHARNDSDRPFHATGYFTGISPFGPAVRLQGPITCLVVDGNRAGFIYQIENGSTPPLFNHLEVKVSVEQGRGGEDSRISFGLPAPAGSTGSCEPGAATSEAGGRITVHHDNN